MGMVSNMAPSTVPAIELPVRVTWKTAGRLPYEDWISTSQLPLAGKAPVSAWAVIGVTSLA